MRIRTLRVGFASILLVLLGGSVSAAAARQPTSRPAADLEAKAGAAAETLAVELTWRDRPLHPEVLRPMMPSFKSGVPEVLRVSVAEAAAQAEALPPATPDPDHERWIFARRSERGTTRYRVDGHLADGRPVVSVAANDGGTTSLLSVMVLRVEELAITPDDGKVIALTLDHLLPLPGLDADVKVGFDFVRVTRPSRQGVEAYERHHHLMPPGAADAGADVPTLEQLDIYNVADLDHDRLLREQIVRDDYRVIAVAGFALSLPGVPRDDQHRVRRNRANYIVLRGTTDATESPEHYAAMIRANAFAHQYNAALWQHLGPMPDEADGAADE